MVFRTLTNLLTPLKPCFQDESDVVFRSQDGKWRAAVVEVVRIHKQGRPVLVGTTSVEQSELISEKLTEAGVKHSVRLPAPLF